MRILKIAGLAGLFFLAAAPSAFAVDSNGDYAIRGAGAQTCATTIAQIEADHQTMSQVVASWLMGYLTAINRTQEQTYDMLPVADPGAIFQMVIGLCQQNPDQLVELVADTLVRLLAPARVATASPLIETRAGDFSATLRQDVLLRMQQRLVELGYTPGTPDGVFGPGTGAALNLYQAVEALPQTGVADSATILRLLIEQQTAAAP